MSNRSFVNLKVTLNYNGGERIIKVCEGVMYGDLKAFRELNFESFEEFDEFLNGHLAKKILNYHDRKKDLLTGNIKIDIGGSSVFTDHCIIHSNKFKKANLIFEEKPCERFPFDRHELARFAVKRPSEFKMFMEDNNLNDGRSIEEYFRKIEFEQICNDWDDVLVKMNEEKDNE